MNTTLSSCTLHGDLLRDCINSRFSEMDALLWMVLLHTHEISMKPGVATNGNGKALLAFSPLTRRGAAEVVATLWTEQHPDDRQRSNYVYWYHQYNTRTPFELASEVPDNLMTRLIELREALARDPRVATVAAEE